jgi:hypothetical protein
MFAKITFLMGAAAGLIYFTIRYGPALLAMLFGN